MPQVRVLNLNTHPYKEKFRGDLIEIPAGGEVEMDADNAKHFLATCNGVKRDGDGQPDPTGFKRLKIEAIQDVVEDESPKFVSNIDGKEFKTQKALNEHLKQFESKTVTDENAERAIAARKNKRSGAA